jgi:5-methylcytosine-specific restriction protein A
VPYAPKKPCAHPGCGQLVPRGRCDAHKKEKRARLDEDAYRMLAHAFYKGKPWKATREQVLMRDPVCVRCNRRPSSIGAHKAHTLRWCMEENERMDLALDLANLEGCCAPCHNRESGQQARVRQQQGALKCLPNPRVETLEPELKGRGGVNLASPGTGNRPGGQARVPPKFQGGGGVAPDGREPV